MVSVVEARRRCSPSLPKHKRFTTESSVNRLFSEATAGIEPAVRVLQTLALPLGDVAMQAKSYATPLDLSIKRSHDHTVKEETPSKSTSLYLATTKSSANALTRSRDRVLVIENTVPSGALTAAI